MAEPVQLAERTLAQSFTTRKFKRPTSPKRCSSKGYYHVWKWFGGPRAPAGTRCQCGLLEDPPSMPN